LEPEEGTVKDKSIIAGLVGGTAMAVFEVILALVFFLVFRVENANLCNSAMLVFFLLANFLPGVLAAHLLSTPRTAGSGAQAGALAGLVAGVTNVVLTLPSLLIGVMQALPVFGYSVLGDLRPLTIVLFCVVTVAWVPFAACLSTLSGALFAALKKD
jgi:hypothetical protein